MDSKSEFLRNIFRVQCLPPCNERKGNLNKIYQAYCVKLDYVDGIDQDSDSDKYHLQATLFDQKYKKFVGSSWRGSSLLIKSKKISFHQSFYFYTAIPGHELILVVELITESKSSNCYKTVGWICMPLLDSNESSPTLENPVSYKIPLLHGTPLALLILKDGNKGAKLSDHTTGMEFSISLMPYPLLLQTVHLVPENVLFDAAHVIPGLINDSQDAVNSTGYVYKPHLQKCITFVLESVCIRIHPSVEEVEKIIIQKIMREHEAIGSSTETASKAQIIQRRLQVGVHNGYRFIQECDFYHLLVEPIVTPKAQKTHQRSSSMGSINYSRENGLTLRSDVKIPNVPDDPNIMFVFLIEYTISLSNTNSDQSNASSINKSPTSNIAISWGFVKLSSLRNNPSHTVSLTSDPSSSPYKLLFLRTQNNFEMSFTAASLTKQNKNLSAGHSVGDFSSVASFSTKTYVSPETSYVHSPATSMSAPKHKSVGDIPMTVTQNEVGCSKSGNSTHAYKDIENNMNLQEVTLVSSSLPLVPPILHSFPVEPGSFKTFTKLYWDKLQPMLDHHGKPAVAIDSSHPYSIHRDLELSSPPQRNECIIQLLAISCLGEYSQIPSEMFFTFQFYRFLPVRTESLLLKPLSETQGTMLPNSSMVYALLKFRGREKSPGFQVTYNIDPSELGTGEYRPFLHYLMKHTLLIDIWNGQSLLYFGTALLPLKYFCRQGKDATSVSLELDIINCEFPDETLSQTAVFSKTCKGKLHLRLASIRHPLPAKSLEKLEEDGLISESFIIFPKADKNKSRVSNLVSKARPIVETNRELTNLLATRCVVNCSQKSQDTYLSEERKRKLARMEAIRNLEKEKKATSVMDDGMHHFLKERERDLLTIESYIQKNKSDMIQSLLHTSITYEKVIYPVIGNKAYFEFVLENPFPEPKEVEVSWKCPELSIVTDHKLWQMLRSLHNIPKKVDHIAFGDLNRDVPSMLLQPKEKIHIPFTYCSLAVQSNQLEIFKTASGHHFTSDILTSAPVSSCLVTSTVKIRFMTSDQTLLAVLILRIQPLPPSFTHVFKFLSMEHSMSKKVIRINSEVLRKHKISVCCSDSEAVCKVQEPHDWEDDISIEIKAPTKAAGKLKEFYLFLYKDSHQIVSYQTWIITICPLQRIDLSCISGQLMRSSLLIRGTHATNLVRCFSSSSDLQLDPSDSFLLSPFAVQELSMNVRSLIPGIKHFQITMVNQALELVLQSWLLVLTCQKPYVSKAFQVHLTTGKEATKRITYTNPYNQDRTFVLHSSHPHLLHLRENKFCVPMGKSYCIGLYFLPQEHVFIETLFLYLNDMADKNEETYCIKVICQ